MQIGAFSVVIRQTNIIWVLFVACTGIIDIAETRGNNNAKTAESDVSISKPDLPYASSTMGLNLRKRKVVKAVDTVKSSVPSIHASSPSSSSGSLYTCLIQPPCLFYAHDKVTL